MTSPSVQSATVTSAIARIKANACRPAFSARWWVGSAARPAGKSPSYPDARIRPSRFSSSQWIAVSRHTDLRAIRIVSPEQHPGLEHSSDFCWILRVIRVKSGTNPNGRCLGPPGAGYTATEAPCASTTVAATTTTAASSTTTPSGYDDNRGVGLDHDDNGHLPGCLREKDSSGDLPGQVGVPGRSRSHVGHPRAALLSGDSVCVRRVRSLN
jgi:hypothetical protein